MLSRYLLAGVNQLATTQYNSEKFGKVGSLFGVSYESYATRQEADQALLRIKKETDKHAWIKRVE